MEIKKKCLNILLNRPKGKIKLKTCSFGGKGKFSINSRKGIQGYTIVLF